MTQEIMIDGRPVKFRATAGVPRLYRIRFGRDMMADMAILGKCMESQQLSAMDLTVFEDVAYIMAKHADPDNVPGTPDEWLDQFSVFSIYEILPRIAGLWGLNLQTTAESKKKSNLSIGL